MTCSRDVATRFFRCARVSRLRAPEALGAGLMTPPPEARALALGVTALGALALGATALGAGLMTPPPEARALALGATALGAGLMTPPPESRP
jgi:hypothetical protein